MSRNTDIWYCWDVYFPTPVIFFFQKALLDKGGKYNAGYKEKMLEQLPTVKSHTLQSSFCLNQQITEENCV